ncbi:MAG: hypothetical protein ACQETB_07675 [Halobacteriota archaeon]
MNITDDNQIECSRCAEFIPLEDAVTLEKGVSIVKPLCHDCLSIVGVPKGYELTRDITYLRR